jgi:hypothetical protein
LGGDDEGIFFVVVWLISSCGIFWGEIIFLNLKFLNKLSAFLF